MGYEIPVRIGKKRIANNKRNTNLIQVKILRPAPPVSTIIPKCLVNNARSIAKPDASPALNAELIINNVDTCIIWETWLTEKIQSSLICPNGYVIVREDRGRSCHGGGVAVLCRSDWKVNILVLQNRFECLWCKIQTKNSKFYVGAIYYPPDPQYLESEFLDNISANCEQILLIDPNAK